MVKTLSAAVLSVVLAVGHATGTSTVIRSRYRVPWPFTDPIHFRSLNTETLPLNGE